MTRTQWTVVVGLLLFILVIFGILLFQLRVPEQRSTPPPPAFLLEEGAQARTVLPIAQQEALRWQEDAQLTSAGVVWDDLGPGGILKRDRWTFEFYSPSQQRMAVIRVIDGEAQLLRTALLPNRLQPLPFDQWQVDSTQALQTWWERGGGDFVRRHTHVSISLKLRIVPPDPRLLWIVAGSSTDQHWVVQMNSGDGTVLE
jgi:hypothetical protein